MLTHVVEHEVVELFPLENLSKELFNYLYMKGKTRADVNRRTEESKEYK